MNAFVRIVLDRFRIREPSIRFTSVVLVFWVFFRFLFHLFFPCDPVDGYTRLDGIDILDESKEEIPRFAPIVLPDRIHDSFFFRPTLTYTIIKK